MLCIFQNLVNNCPKIKKSQHYTTLVLSHLCMYICLNINAIQMIENSGNISENISLQRFTVLLRLR